MLVRGKIVVGTMQSGALVSESNQDCLVAVTHWYRHDDNLKTLEEDMDALVNLYEKFKKTYSVVAQYEYKEYRK